MSKNAILAALALVCAFAAPVAAKTHHHTHTTFPTHRDTVSLASFYGAGEPLQLHTASGEVFKPLGMTCAHRTLPLGTRVRVRLGKRSVVVRVNDRGPAAWTHREIDLSLGAARVIGLTAKGVAPVEIAVLN